MQTAQVDLPRGIRNNNPGNLKHSPANHWHGELLPPDDEYCRFDTAHNGLRAFAINLWSYYNKDNCKTLTQIITRHAPDTENNTKAYIADVSSSLHAVPDDVYNIENKIKTAWLIIEMIRHENGMVPYSLNDINSALIDTGHWQ